MDVLANRILIRPRDGQRSRHFYRDLLGLAVSREFGDPADPGVVFFLGGGFLEVSGSIPDVPADPAGASQPASGPAPARLWLQVRDVAAEHERLAALGVPILREPREEPWGLIEMWVADPDGLPIVLVEVPAQHPLRQDNRGSDPQA